jgi:hypothetical protein
MMFCLAIGCACVHNAHVRLDLFRPRLGRLWVKLFGGPVLPLPFLAARTRAVRRTRGTLLEAASIRCMDALPAIVRARGASAFDSRRRDVK